MQQTAADDLEGVQGEAVGNGGTLVRGEGGEEGHARQALLVALPLLHAAHHYDGAEGAALHAPHHPPTLSLYPTPHTQAGRQAGRQASNHVNKSRGTD